MVHKVVLLLFTLLLIQIIVNSDGKAFDKLKQVNYLRQYKYMRNEPPIVVNSRKGNEKNTDNSFQKAVKLFQMTYGIKPTGQVNEETRNLMTKPRCGVTDIEDDHSWMSRSKRATYMYGGPWKKKTLTYQIRQFTSDLSTKTVADTFKQAVKIWEEFGDIKLTNVDKDSDIEILFVNGSHGDSFDFDGESGTLAHAFGPRYGGSIHFDDDESWTSRGYNGINLLQIAVHELGHALGLGHSKYKESVMYAIYSYRDTNTYRLHSDDIEGIQYLYGASKTTNKNKEVTMSTPSIKVTKVNRGTMTTTSTSVTTSYTPTVQSQTTRQEMSEMTTLRSTVGLRTVEPSTELISTGNRKTTKTQSTKSNSATTVSILTYPVISSKTTAAAPSKTTSQTTLKHSATSRKTSFTKQDTTMTSTTATFTSKYTTVVYNSIPCPHLFDAITLDDRHLLHIFQGDQHIQLQKTVTGVFRVSKGFPKLISNSYKGLPDNLDAAIYLPNIEQVKCIRRNIWYRCSKTATVLQRARTYFFKDNRYYIYIDGMLSSSGLIGDHFTGVPCDIDAAFTINGDNIFLVKGNKYWKVSRLTRRVYGPSDFSDFQGIPSSIQDVLYTRMYYNNKYHNVNMFFSQQKYYRISDGTYKVDKNPSYPRDTSEWLGCKQGRLSTVITDEKKRSLSPQMDRDQINVYMDQYSHVINQFKPNVKWENSLNYKNVHNSSQGGFNRHNYILVLLFCAVLVIK